MVRDAIGLAGTGNWNRYNPFDQLLTPMSPGNRVSGRDLFSDLGMMRRNRETGVMGWLSDPGEGARDLAGFAGEVILDPTSWMTFGGSALSRTGRVARASGLLDDVARQGAARNIGPRMARRTMTIGDLVHGSADPVAARAAVGEAAVGMGLNADEVLESTEKLGGMFGVGPIFGDPAWVVDGGRVGDVLAGGMDAFGGYLKKTAPVRFARQLFDSSVGGKGNPLQQEIQELAYKDRPVAEAIAKTDYAKHFSEIDEVFRAFDDTFGEQIRRSSLTDVDPRDLDQEIESLLSERLDLWKRDMAVWENPYSAMEREFRQKHLVTINRLRNWDRTIPERDEALKWFAEVRKGTLDQRQAMTWAEDRGGKTLRFFKKMLSDPKYGDGLLKEMDPDAISRFDELRDEWRSMSGVDLDEDAFHQMLLKTDPKPIRPNKNQASIINEATGNIRKRQLFGSGGSGATEDAVGDLAGGGIDEFADDVDFPYGENAPVENTAKQSVNTVEHKFFSGDVVIASDRGNFGYVRRVGPKTSEVFFRNPETGSTAVRIMPNDQLTAAFPSGSKESASAAEEYSRLMTRKIFDDILMMTAETGDANKAFEEIMGEVPDVGQYDSLSQAIAARADDMKAANRAVYTAIESKGGKVAWLTKDDEGFGVEHFPRTVDPKVAKESTGSAVLARRFENMQGRTPETRDIPEAIVNRLARESRYRGEGAAKRIHEDFKEYLNPRYGQEVEKGKLKPVDQKNAPAPVDTSMDHAKALETWLDGRAKIDVYTRAPLENFLRYQKKAQLVSRTMEAVHEVFHRYAGKGESTLESAFRAADMDVDRSIEHFAQKFNISPEQARSMRVPSEVVQQVRGLNEVYKAPEWAQAIGEAVDNFNRMFKAWVTVPFPSFAARNLSSGQLVNVSSGLVNGTGDLGAYKAAFMDADKLEKLARKSPDQMTPQQQQFLREIWGWEVVQDKGFMDVDFRQPANIGVGATQPEMGIVPQSPFGVTQTAQQARDYVGRTPSMVDAIPGALGARRAARTAIDTGAKVNQKVEWQNRVTMYLYLRKKGWSPRAASAEVNKLQFDYSDLSPFERDVMRRAVPFYGFTRKVIPMVIDTLTKRPGGVMGQTIRASNQGDQSQPLPDHIAQEAAIPVETLEDGTKRFITGFGMAHEVPLGFLGGGIRGVGLEALSMTSPLIKGPLEYATGQSFFQRGPEGGRPFSDMDPTLGRLATNLGMQSELPSGQAAPLFGNSLLENVVANSPFSRLTTTARQLSDSRKWEGTVPGLGLGVNLFTGMRMSDVSPAAQDAVIREAYSALAKQSGARAYSNTRFPKDAIEEAKKSDPEEARKMQAFNDLMNLLARRQRDRKKNAEKN
jgi:hypothetical protein